MCWKSSLNGELLWQLQTPSSGFSGLKKKKKAFCLATTGTEKSPQGKALHASFYVQSGVVNYTKISTEEI